MWFYGEVVEIAKKHTDNEIVRELEEEYEKTKELILGE